jgi:cell division protein FtsZ
MITEKAAPDVEFIFGTSFKEEMQDEMTITVIAAGFDKGDSDALLDEDFPKNNIPPITPTAETPDPKKQATARRKPVSSNDDDLADIFKILDNK